MALVLSDKQRNVIPRWRKSKVAAQLGELNPLPHPSNITEFDKTSIHEKIQTWQADPGLDTAGELISAALVLGEYDHAKEAINYFLKNKKRLSETDNKIASIISNTKDEVSQFTSVDSPEDTIAGLRKKIRDSRNRSRANPKNVLAWVDLARAYVSLGLHHKAIDNIEIALRLFPNNRFVLRSATRLFLTSEDPERALKLLRGSPLIKKDPWLLSAEIASSSAAQDKSRVNNTVRRSIINLDVAPFHLSELYAALATEEFLSGNDKKAKKLFQSALEQPTDNVLAQAEWTEKNGLFLPYHEGLRSMPYSYEARALNLIQDEDWSGAVEQCGYWHRDEPFSSRPSLEASFIASTYLEDYALAEKISRTGLQSQPYNNDLMNNLAYDLACQDKIQEAKSVINKIDQHNSVCLKLCVTATKGLISFRSGDLDEGRSFYEEAISGAEKAGEKELKMRASVNLCNEEIRVGSDKVFPMLNNVLQGVQGFTSAEVKKSIKKLRYEIEHTDAKILREDPKLMDCLDKLNSSIKESLSKKSAGFSGVEA